MSYQFEIYPSGNPSNYKVKVNSSDGVSAIIDKQMGITEYSLSGVAFYIKAISDYINQYNVGTSTLPITSGFFQHIGYTNYTNTQGYPLRISPDGIVSGVYSLNTSGIYFYGDKLFIGDITALSGCITSGNISGMQIPASSCIFYNSLYNDNYYIGSSGILSNISIRDRIGIPANEIGIIKGNLITNTITINDTDNINVYGNFYILGSYKPNLSGLTTNKSIDESIFDFTTHTHDGINSKQVTLESFNSNKSINNPFDLNLTSGNLKVTKSFIGNTIGLSSNWEVFDFPNVDNIQKLITCSNKLYAMDEDNITEYGGNTLKTPTYSDYNSLGLVISTEIGSSPAILTYIEEDGMITGFSITSFNGLLNERWFFKNQGATEYFKNIYDRKILPTDKGVVIGNNIYLSFIEEYNSEDVLTLYEINTITRSLKPVAHYELFDAGEGWRILPPIKFKTMIYYFIYGNGTKKCLVYNTVYRPGKSSYTSVGSLALVLNERKFEYNDDIRYGFNVFGVDDPFNLTMGLDNIQFNTSQTSRSYSSYTYFMNKVYFTSDKQFNGYSLLPTERNSASINPSVGNSTSIIAYAGKLWYGNSLHISKNTDGKIKTDIRLFNKLKEITRLDSPWVINPIIYKGWLYGIAPIVEYNTWEAVTSSKLHEIDDNAPEGSLIVRRRASETELIEMMAYSL